MFWKFNLLTTRIDTLLEKEDVTLHEVLDEDDVLQECKAQNKKLVEFLVRSENMEELVNLLTQEPDVETEDKVKYKYPNTACELLTSDVPQITETLATDEALLNKVYSFLESEGSLNPLQASFFSKVMGLLITRKSELMVEFLQHKEDFVGHLLHHIGVSAIMDLLLRLITCIESADCRMACINWLNEQNIIQKLIAMIDPLQAEEKICNVAQSLCDVVLLSREQMSHLQERAEPDPLLATIEAQETICDLLSHMFDGEKVEAVIVNGLAIIQSLLEFRKTSLEGCQEQMTALDAERLAQGVRNTLASVTPRLKDFHQLLQEPPKQHYQPMPVTYGELSTPLGNTRLQVCRLLASLLLTNTSHVNSQLAQNGTLNVLLDLYFKFLWNNFLHTQVELCVATILSASPAEDEDGKVDHPLLVQLFTECKLLERILDAWEDNEQQQSRPGGRRRGYMGHLTKIANQIVESREKSANAERINDIFQDLSSDLRERWDTFVSGNLADTNKQNTVELVGGHLQSSSEDDDPDFRDIPFPQDTAMQQAYSDYQLQPMTSNFIEQFGFNEDEINDQEERVDAPFTDRISSINFDINVEDNPNAASMFEQACNERMQQFDDQESEEDLWETKEITFSKAAANRPSSTVELPKTPSSQPDSDEEEEEGSEGSTDSEEDLDSPRRIFQSTATTTTTSSEPSQSTPTTVAASSTAENMEVDSSDNWANFDDVVMDSSSQGPVAMETSGAVPTAWTEPAASSTPSSTENPEGEWASFDDAQNNAASSSSQGFGDFADFSSIDNNLSTTAPELRGSTDVEMEASESVPATSDRTAAYMVSSAPADLATEVSEAASSSTGPPPPEKPREAWSPDQPSSSSPSSTTSSAPSSSTSSGCVANHSGSEVTAADSTSAQSSAQGEEQAAPSAPEPSEQPSEGAGDTISSSSGSGSPPASPAPPPPEDGPPEDGQDQAEQASQSQQHDDDQDLETNFNFLCSSGLLRADQPEDSRVSSSSSSSSASSSDAAAADTTPDTTPDAAAAAATPADSVEEIRAQAKEALQQFTHYANTTSGGADSPASSSSSSSSDSQQNGPI